jgi:hypothetical protein
MEPFAQRPTRFALPLAKRRLGIMVLGPAYVGGTSVPERHESSKPLSLPGCAIDPFAKDWRGICPDGQRANGGHLLKRKRQPDDVGCPTWRVFASTPLLPVQSGMVVFAQTAQHDRQAPFAQTAAYPKMAPFAHMVLKAEMVGYASMPPDAQTVPYSQMVALEQEPCQPRNGCRNNRLFGRLRTSPQPDRHPQNQGSGPWSTRRELLRTLVTCRRARAPRCAPL